MGGARPGAVLRLRGVDEATTARRRRSRPLQPRQAPRVPPPRRPATSATTSRPPRAAPQRPAAAASARPRRRRSGRTGRRLGQRDRRRWCTCAPTCSISTSAPTAARSARVDLPAYPKVKGEAAPVRLENEDDAADALRAAVRPDRPGRRRLPDASRHLQQRPRRATSSTAASELRVPLTWSEGGVTVTKTYVFRRGEYAIDVEYEVHNGGSAAWEARAVRADPAQRPAHQALVLQRRELRLPRPGDLGRQQVPQARHRAARTTATCRSTCTDGWIAALQHHFVSAIVPPRGDAVALRLGAAGAAVPAVGHRAGAERGARRGRRASTTRCSSARSCRRSSKPPRPSSGAWPTTGGCGSWRGRCSWRSS